MVSSSHSLSHDCVFPVCLRAGGGGSFPEEGAYASERLDKDFRSPGSPQLLYPIP